MPTSLVNADIDLSFLNEIADGSDEFIIESIDMFLEQGPAMLTAISEAIAKQEWAVAAAEAHKLKPTLGFFGMNNSQALLQEVELLCKTDAHVPGPIMENFNQAKELLSANFVALTHIKEEKQAGL